jgi:uncharacterized protein (TIGR03435 family)
VPVISAVSLLGQDNPEPAPPRPAFEVASVKPSPYDARMSVVPTGNGLSIGYLTLKQMIMLAYQVKPYQISGGPSWLDSTRFNINARSESSATWSDLLLMLQSLLADRFRLVIRRESRELPIYVMVLARKDGALGPNLLRSTEESCPPRDQRAETANPDRRVLGCGPAQIGLSKLKVVGVRIGDLATALSGPMARTIIDETGLAGTYDVSLNWSSDDVQRVGPLGSPGPAPAVGDLSAGLVVALQDQLGLKLISRKGAVETFIIGYAEKPSEN